VSIEMLYYVRGTMYYVLCTRYAERCTISNIKWKIDKCTMAPMVKTKYYFPGIENHITTSPHHQIIKSIILEKIS
jgi:hypothetical protein